MKHIADWLQKLGLSEYAQRFAENDIDVSVLPHLTDQDLKDLGLSLGHRRKMLAAIAQLADGTVTPSLQPVLTEPRPQDSAERRQVTVMFSDLVGSTALSARMDPEDLREVIAAYHKSVGEIVRHFDGFVAQYLGDGVLVYFGYPGAHEDDAERAVQTALELTASIGGLNTRVSLQTRIGIATGLVVVGDLMDSGNSPERGIIGETPNLAARLQGIAEPNMVVIAESTRKLLGNLFELQDLGARQLRSIAGPVQSWAVLRVSSAESRFEALHGGGLTDIVGREEELELLVRRWARAKTGEGQVVLLSGEPGIGKSRLTAALLQRIATEPHTRLRYFCSPQHTDSALYPIIGQIERAAGLRREDAREVKLDKLDALLVPTSTSKQAAALVAEMLSLPNDGRYPLLDLTPQQRRQRTLDALIAQMHALASQNPVLMIFEDAHWTDPTTLEAFDRVVDRIRSMPVLLIVTFRPEFTSSWIGRPNVTILTVNRLAERDIGAMIDRLVGDKALSAGIRQEITERTDGIPLFVEEMTKAVLEVEGEGRAEHPVAAVPSAALTVPVSLHASLMARLDRLGPAKGVAQIGATIGRQFSHALLAAVARKPKVDLNSALDRLVVAGLLFRQGAPPYATYLFKHALVRDVAYATLLRDQRRALHCRIAQTLEQQFRDTVELEPETVAQHYAAAGVGEQAVPYWLRAGSRAALRSANREAIRHLQKGIEHLSAFADSSERVRQELAFRTVLGPALLATRGWAAPEALASYVRARQLSEEVGDTAQLFTSLWGTWLLRWARGEISVANGLVQELLDLAHRDGREAFRLQAHHAGWTTSTYRGELEAALQHAEKGMAIYRPAEHGTLAIGYGGHDPGVCARAHSSQPLWLIGYPDKALRTSQASLSLIRYPVDLLAKLGQRHAIRSAKAARVHRTHWWSCGCFAAAHRMGAATG
jgi:class 3 adenylate cyclase